MVLKTDSKPKGVVVKALIKINNNGNRVCKFNLQSKTKYMYRYSNIVTMTASVTRFNIMDAIRNAIDKVTVIKELTRKIRKK